MRRLLVIIIAIFILILVNVSIYQKEQLLAEGMVLLLELAPVDPRSLMQGDYMALRYKIAEELELESSTTPGRDGDLILTLDKNQVGHFKAFAEVEQSLSPKEWRLHFRKRHGQIYLGAESFFFQEGQADEYALARYGELRVNHRGESILVGLRNKKLQTLGTQF